MNNEKVKKTYETPSLVYFGDIREITKTVSSNHGSPDSAGTTRTH